MNIYLLRLVACLLVLLSFNAKALVINGCTIEPHAQCGDGLTDARLSYANLSYTNLSSAFLLNADLSYADLSYANLYNAYLTNANMSSTNLTRADLSFANLTDANLTHADLTDADLSYAFLAGALYNDQTVFTNFDPVAAGMSYVTAAVPVPAAAWLFGSALVGLGLVRRSK